MLAHDPPEPTGLHRVLGMRPPRQAWRLGLPSLWPTATTCVCVLWSCHERAIAAHARRCPMMTSGWREIWATCDGDPGSACPMLDLLQLEAS